MSGSRGGNGTDQRRVGSRAAADAIEKILDVIDGAVSHGIHQQGRRRQEGRPGSVASLLKKGVAGAVQTEGGLGASKDDVAVFYRAGERAGVNDVVAFGILISCGDGVGAFEFGKNVTGAERGYRIRSRFADVPMNDVDPVAEQVCEMAAPEIPEPAPVRAPLGIKGLIWRGAEETFPIDIGSGRGFHGVTIALIPGRLNERNTAEAS